jgi:hypothetical protein
MEMYMEQEKIGPAERLIQTVLAFTDHAVHNRPGLIVADGRTKTGVRWDYVTHKVEGENGEKVVYRLTKVGKKTTQTRAGILGQDGKVREGNAVVGEYRKPGLFPEVVTYLYTQVAEVWKLDNELAARWASYQFGQDHKDLKVILAAFMLVQSRKGEPVMENGKVAFCDDDFRDVGEAMMLIFNKDKDKSLTPKLLLRIREVLEVPGVAQLNRELGFGRSAREPVLGRWTKVVHKWLRYREQNPKLLEGLVKAGLRSTVMALAARSGYKPETVHFFEVLRWKQTQSKDGRRQMLGANIVAAETWEGQTEEQICQRIMGTKPGWKVIVGRVPKSVGITRAIVAAAIESGAMSDKDLIIATPTLEELGLMEVQSVKDRWQKAIRAADDMRAANIATRVKSKEVKESLEGAADTALQKAAAEVMRGMRVYVCVDRSGSMHVAIEAAIRLLTRLLPAFPEDKVHVSYFNTAGNEVTFKSRTAAGVAQAFRGVAGSGGTDYGAGVRVLQGHKPGPDEDTLMIFIGDQEANAFTPAVQASGINPMAFGMVQVAGGTNHHCVEQTAAQLGIPCFNIAEETFADTYAIPRTIRALIAATPVGVTATRTAPTRVTLVESIIKHPLLIKPSWAA